MTLHETVRPRAEVFAYESEGAEASEAARDEVRRAWSCCLEKASAKKKFVASTSASISCTL